MYGTTLSFATLVSLLLGEKLAKSQKLNLEIYWQTAFIGILGGIFGARMYHVFSLWHYYSQNPLLILDFRRGGLGILGGIIAGFILSAVFLKFKKENILKWLDLSAILLPLAQAIGRIGNFFNQEIFGRPTNLPWGIYIPRSKRPDEYINNDIFHPLFLYELILDLLLFTILYRLYTQLQTRPPGASAKSQRKFDGKFFIYYLLSYGIIRYFMEFLKIDPWMVVNINIAQLISLIFVSISLLFLIKKLNSYR